MALPDRVMLPDDAPGQGLYRLDVVATIVFTIAAVISTIGPEGLRIAFAVLSAVLFAVGCLAFLWAFAKALDRSRDQDISLPGIFGLSGSTPKPVQRRFHLVTTVQSVVAFVAAAIHPFTPQAFGILMPMLGLGLGGLWAATHGQFGPRTHGRHIRQMQQKDTSTNG